MRILHFCIHAISYYLSWFACIGFAGMGFAWLGPFITVAFLCGQVFLQVSMRLSWRPAFAFASILMFFGMLIDSILMHLGYIHFNANPFAPWLSPPWMSCLWLSFGFTMLVIRLSLLRYTLLLATLTLFFLPFAYWLGVVFYAAKVESAAFYPILGGLWMILLPILVQQYFRYTATQ